MLFDLFCDFLQCVFVEIEVIVDEEVGNVEDIVVDSGLGVVYQCFFDSWFLVVCQDVCFVQVCVIEGFGESVWIIYFGVGFLDVVEFCSEIFVQIIFIDGYEIFVY